MKYLHLDNEIYAISDDDMNNVCSAVGGCCGICCKETLQDLREVFLDIKNRYKPHDVEGHHTMPNDQFDKNSKDYFQDKAVF